MLNEFAYAGDGDPRESLSRARDLVGRVRAAQRATWFPLLVFAAVIFASIPVERYSGYHTVKCERIPTPQGAGLACAAYSTGLLVYWPIALSLAYVAVAAFYVHQSRRRGVGTRIRPYVIAGIILAAVLVGAGLWEVYHLPFTGAPSVATLIGVRASAAAAIGIALLVLAWAERNLALLAFTAGYLLIVLVPITFGWRAIGRWAFAPDLVIAASVLLLGSVGFAIAQRRARLPAP